MNKKIVSIVLCAGIQYSNAYIYEAQVLTKQNFSNNNAKTVIGLSDFHDKVLSANAEQRSIIETIMQRCDKQKTKWLLEDLSSPSWDGRKGCGNYAINSRGGILGGLTQKCLDQTLKVENHEYRFCRVASLGPIINNLTKPVEEHACPKSISMGTLMQEIDALVTRINTYDDGHALNNSYKDTMGRVANERDLLIHASHASWCVADFIKQYSSMESRMDLLKKLLTFDSEMLDICFTHSIVHADESVIIAIAGGSHINRICSMLENDGYKTTHKTTIKYGKEYDLKNCLGSTIIDNNFCVRPTPISLHFLVPLMEKISCNQSR